MLTCDCCGKEGYVDGFGLCSMCRKYRSMPEREIFKLKAENTALKAKLDKGRIEGILADPTHWCPSKAEQWKRIANAIIEDK